MMEEVHGGEGPSGQSALEACKVTPESLTDFTAHMSQASERRRQIFTLHAAIKGLLPRGHDHIPNLCLQITVALRRCHQPVHSQGCKAATGQRIERLQGGRLTLQTILRAWVPRGAPNCRNPQLQTSMLLRAGQVMTMNMVERMPSNIASGSIAGCMHACLLSVLCLMWAGWQCCIIHY